MRFIARRYDNAQLVRVTVSQGRVARLEPWQETSQKAADIPWIAPGFVDIQVNGYGGQEFSSHDLTVEKVARIVRHHHAFGVTAFLPTLTTQSFECLAHGLRTISSACRQDMAVQRSVHGIHVEGPFIATEDGPRGAHPIEHCRRPDWEEFQRLQEAAEGRIRLLTLSAEYDEAPAFVERAVASGVVVAIGHTAATSHQIRTVVDAGASLSTHLGNGAHRMLRRHPNYLWDQLAEDRLMASLIVDGHHLPSEVVKVFIRAKTADRCILVSDVSGLAGLPRGRYTSSGCELEVLDDGRLVIAGQDQLLAGASLPIGACVANVMRFANLDLVDAIALASQRPAALIGAQVGGLEIGQIADFVLFQLDQEAASNQMRIVATLIRGELMHGELGRFD